MLRRLLALASVSFVSYLTGFVAAFTVYMVIQVPFSRVLEALGNSISTTLALGTIGGAVVAGVAVIKRKTIAQSTLGRWLGVVAATGIAHFAILATAAYLGFEPRPSDLLAIGVFAVCPPLVAGTLLLQKRALGLQRREQLRPPA